jgi:3-hydroxyacyl-CoA dehydrogenase/enoyl-CoA hydratase/3-hydroxybutyryl-CoA epimerase
MSILTAIHADRLELGPHRHLGEVPATSVGTSWQRLRDSDGIDWLLLDQPDAKVNSVNDAMLEELDKLLGEIERDRPKGVVLRSAKLSGFIAGADIAQFRGATDAKLIAQRLSRAHQITDRLAALPVPTVAVIHDFCLGGGLELALACRTRIAISTASLGFPEVQLGLHPGLGGTARLTRLINPVDAMTMMLTGRRKFARAAYAAGLVDVLTEERHVAAAVQAAVNGHVRSRRRGWLAGLLNLAPARWIAARRMRREAGHRAPPAHYPAPNALIDLWQHHGGNITTMKRREVTSFANLVTGETAQNLIRVFFLREQMKKGAETGREIRHVHVIGAGAMGADIATWCALRGLRVTLADNNPAALAKAMQRAAKEIEHEAHSSIERRDARDRLVLDPKGAGAGRADLVIEAVPENLELKRKLLGGIETKLSEHAILATNTSSIRLEDIRTTLKHPERLVGIHFFNPVAKMQLVEVISHDATTAEATSAARRFVIDIDRLPVAVKSAPGFIVNRALMPYLLEALLLLDEKVPAEAIDTAAVQFGMPMGPIELADEVGLDICLDVAKVLRANLKQPVADLPPWFEDKVKKGELGKKTGRGFYLYVDGKPQKLAAGAAPDPALADRLILPLLNACAACLREGVAASEDDIDGALIFGAGFAPFRGGPMHYARQRGFAEIKNALQDLQRKLGERFTPDAYWDQ